MPGSQFSLHGGRKGRREMTQSRNQEAFMHKTSSSDSTSTSKMFFSGALKPFFIPPRAQA